MFDADLNGVTVTEWMTARLSLPAGRNCRLFNVLICLIFGFVLLSIRFEKKKRSKHERWYNYSDGAGSLYCMKAAAQMILWWDCWHVSSSKYRVVRIAFHGHARSASPAFCVTVLYVRSIRMSFWFLTLICRWRAASLDVRRKCS